MLLGIFGIYAGLIYLRDSNVTCPIVFTSDTVWGLFFVVAILLRPVRFVIQDRIDRLFHRDTYLIA